jgi:site-specific recombinase XerD
MVDVLGSRVLGPLESYAPGFAAGLFRQGYTVSGASQHLCFIAHLSRWMLACGWEVSTLTPEVVDEYFAARRSAGYVNYRSVKAMRPLLDYLEPLDVLPQLAPVVLGPVDVLLERYREYLILERGLTTATARGYIDSVRPFVAGRARRDGLDMVGLTASDVNRFVLDACPHRATGSAKLIVTALRSLLNFLYLSGQVGESLASAVPSVAGWRLSELPKGLGSDELRALLASCDRRRATGRRDYAIMLMLSRLGLRAGEVAALGLDDIEWQTGQFAVRGKGNRVERLPLPADVGAAIAGYLRRGRPATAQGRSVFVRVHAPHRALTPGGVTMVVFDAARRAGLGKIHAHRLRHTAATQMLRAGTPLADVGQVLRHRSALSTAIYAKVDREALRALARPWPGTTTGGAS